MFKKFIFFLTICCLPMTAHAHGQDKADTFYIETPYAFATAQNAKTGAIFMTIENYSQHTQSLIKAAADVAEIVEVHQNYIDPDDGQMMMRRVRQIDIPAEKHTILEPTGYHIMLINLKAPLQIGDSFPVTLTFESGIEFDVDVIVVAPGTKPEPHQHEAHNHEEELEDFDHTKEDKLNFLNTKLKAN